MLGGQLIRQAISVFTVLMISKDICIGLVVGQVNVINSTENQGKLVSMYLDHNISTIKLEPFVDNASKSDSSMINFKIRQTLQHGIVRGDQKSIIFAGGNYATMGFGLFRSTSVFLHRNKIQIIQTGAFQGDFSGEIISIENNTIQLLKSGVFQGYYNHTFLSLVGNVFEQIEPGVFRGNFSEARVILERNSLNQFEEVIFKEILEQMDTSSGLIIALKNPFDCTSDPCHLAWLIRDNRHLLSSVEASCTNGTSFKDLDPNAFSECGIPMPVSVVTSRTTRATSTTKTPSNSSVRTMVLNQGYRIITFALLFVILITSDFQMY